MAAIPKEMQVVMASTTLGVLLLEDETLISMDLEAALRLEGFDVTTAASCTEAHAWLDRNIPDIVIVDIELRDGNCTEVVARLVEAKVPFVVHSGDYSSSYVGTPFARGAWVGKPAAPEELIRAMRAALGGFAQPSVQVVLVKAGDVDELARIGDMEHAARNGHGAAFA